MKFLTVNYLGDGQMFHIGTIQAHDEIDSIELNDKLICAVLEHFDLSELETAPSIKLNDCINGNNTEFIITHNAFGSAETINIEIRETWLY